MENIPKHGNEQRSTKMNKLTQLITRANQEHTVMLYPAYVIDEELHMGPFSEQQQTALHGGRT